MNVCQIALFIMSILIYKGLNCVKCSSHFYSLNLNILKLSKDILKSLLLYLSISKLFYFIVNRFIYLSYRSNLFLL